MAYIPNKIKGEDTIYEMVHKINGAMEQLKETDETAQSSFTNAKNYTDAKVLEVNERIDNETNRIDNDVSEIDGKVQQTINNLSSHENNNKVHITEEERINWNSKADGNHNHDNKYEKILPTEQKRRITFGTEDPAGGSHGDIYFKIQE